MLKKVEKKKGCNATKKKNDEIVFRFTLEVYKYQKLKEEGISAKYEHKSNILFPIFEYKNFTVRVIIYLPFFVENIFVIEGKGFATDS